MFFVNQKMEKIQNSGKNQENWPTKMKSQKIISSFSTKKKFQNFFLEN